MTNKTIEFINKSNKIHNNKYNYSKTIYINARTKVCIICPIHGEFWQTPDNHINKKCGCPKCKYTNDSKNMTVSLKDILIECQKIHRNKYDYTLITEENYINMSVKVSIICPDHGLFSQKMAKHSHGQGCPKCKMSKGEREIINYLLSENIKFICQYKFEKCIGKRFKLPFDFYLPDYNTCIEYDGKQHFDKTSRFYSIELIENDKIKTEYCTTNNIRLIRIPYWEIKNINDFMTL